MSGWLTKLVTSWRTHWLLHRLYKAGGPRQRYLARELQLRQLPHSAANEGEKTLKTGEQGFTLIELMIVTAIIGILAAIAIPQYQDYVSRAKWADNISAVDQVKTAIAECSQNNSGVLATNCDALPALIGGGFLSANFVLNPTPFESTAPTITVGTAAIVMTGTAQVGGCTVTMTPTVTSDTISWAYTDGGAAGCNKAKTGV